MEGRAPPRPKVVSYVHQVLIAGSHWLLVGRSNPAKLSPRQLSAGGFFIREGIHITTRILQWLLVVVG